MLCNIQELLEINLPEQHQDMVTAYNTEWDADHGQAWEIKKVLLLV